MRRDSTQASRNRHCRAGRPIVSPLVPGCSVAGDQDPSRFLVRGSMRRRCPECKPAAPRQTPSVLRPWKTDSGGGWLGLGAQLTRRAASAPSGPPATRGERRSPCSGTLVWTCSPADVSTRGFRAGSPRALPDLLRGAPGGGRLRCGQDMSGVNISVVPEPPCADPNRWGY